MSNLVKLTNWDMIVNPSEVQNITVDRLHNKGYNVSIHFRRANHYTETTSWSMFFNTKEEAQKELDSVYARLI